MTLLYILSSNGYTIKLKTLANTRANSFAFINTLYIIDIAKFLGVKAQCLPFSTRINGYNGKGSYTITHFIRLYFTIDRRR